MWSKLSGDEGIAGPQLPQLSAALPRAESPQSPHELDEEGAVNGVPHVADGDEDSAEPQPPPVALPQAESPHELNEGAVDDVRHVPSDGDGDSAGPQLPPVALPQAESPHELDEEGAVDDEPQVEVNGEDGRGVFGSRGVSVFLRAIFTSWSVGCRYVNKEFGRSEGLCLPQSNHIGIPVFMKILAW